MLLNTGLFPSRFSSEPDPIQGLKEVFQADGALPYLPETSQNGGGARL